MPKPSVSIKLYGEQAEEFRRLKDRLEDTLGYEPPNSQVVGLLMAGDELDVPRGTESNPR